MPFDGVKVAILYMSEGDLRVSLNPFINSFLNKATGDVSRSELTIRQYNLSFSVLLTLAFINIQLANQAIANKMSCEPTKKCKPNSQSVQDEVWCSIKEHWWASNLLGQ